MTELLFRDAPYRIRSCTSWSRAHPDFDIGMEKLSREEIEAGLDVDLQAWGGTHVGNTAEIGRLAVARIRSEGKRNKRVTLVLAP